jgi:primosomal protein N' (replication factor Y) (superfamily II helicase)
MTKSLLPSPSDDTPSGATKAVCADVLLPIAVDRPYTYAVPAGLEVQEGAVVRVPLGARDVFGVVWRIFPQHESKLASPRLKEIKNITSIPLLPALLRRFLDWVADYTLAPRGNVLALAMRTPDDERPLQPRLGVKLTAQKPLRMTPARQRLLHVMHSATGLRKAELAQEAGVSVSVVDGLIDEGVLETFPLAPQPIVQPLTADYARPVLSTEQEHAAAQLRASVRKGGFEVTLLEGVTGSGKTETYFEAVADVIRKGQQVLILMPEIALTAPFVHRFAARFGHKPALWHSGLSERMKSQFAASIASGEAQVVTGARSALFLPFPRLGLIIIDEEHEAAYKQEEGVLYQARDMAVVRASIEHIPIILASATPSLETQINVVRGKYQRVMLPDRFGGRTLPRLHAIDLRATPPSQPQHWLSPPLIDAMRNTLAQKEQVLLYLNRRGYAPLTVCRACGHRYQCTNCSAWLVDHRKRRALVCHQCGHTEQRPSACAECGSIDSLIAAGPGVERIAEEAKALFPSHTVLVLSSDMAGGATQLQHDLHAITQGEVDIIIGTQIVAKGHHFPHITCVGVVDADVGLASGDPRASERTFQMLQQVTGRAGRGEKAGHAYIQTYQPTHPVVQALLKGEGDAFYAQERQMREKAALPPFARIASVIISGPDHKSTEHYARALARSVPTRCHFTILGPAEAPIAMIRGRYRFRLLIKAPRAVPLSKEIKTWIAQAPKPSGALRVVVDMDPYSFM